LPSEVALGIDEATAKQLKEKLEAAGGTVIME
jgi:hypothetical protein